MLLTVMTVIPVCLIYGQPLEEILKIIQTFDNEFTADKACFLPGLLAAIGAWAGAVVVPLDWDRPWQV